MVFAVRYILKNYKNESSIKNFPELGCANLGVILDKNKCFELRYWSIESLDSFLIEQKLKAIRTKAIADKKLEPSWMKP